MSSREYFLKKLRFAVGQMYTKEYIESLSEVTVTDATEYFSNDLLLKLKVDVWSESISKGMTKVSFKQPKNWFEHLKEDTKNNLLGKLLVKLTGEVKYVYEGKKVYFHQYVKYPEYRHSLGKGVEQVNINILEWQGEE